MESTPINITNDMKEKIKTITGTKATVMKYVYAKIFTKDLNSEEWVNSGLQGYLCLTYDRSFKGSIIRMFHPRTAYCIFEFEMYYNFDKAYVIQDDLFHFFCIPSGFIGFSYADAKQSKSFGKLVKSRAIKKKIDPTKYQQAKSRQGVIVGRSRDRTVKKTGPTNFKQVGGFSMSMEGGKIDIDKLPKQYRQLLKGAGVKKSDLKDANMAPVIMGILQDNLVEEQDRVNIPPPPMAPPPPMLDLGSNTGGGKTQGMSANAMMMEIENTRKNLAKREINAPVKLPETMTKKKQGTVQNALQEAILARRLQLEKMKKDGGDSHSSSYESDDDEWSSESD